MNYKLALALLFAAPAFAADSGFQEAQRKVAAAQDRVNAAEKQVEMLRRHVEAGSAKASAAASKGYNHKEHITTHTGWTRGKITAHHRARKELHTAEKELISVLKQVGKTHTVCETGGKWSVSKPAAAAEKPLEPIRMARPVSSGYGYSRTARAA